MAAPENYYPHYTPSIAAAAIFIVLFSALFIIHVFRLIKTRTWFCIPFIIGALLEILGYIGRAVGNSKPTTFGPYVLQVLLILLGPILFAASIYMFLGRLIIATSSSKLSIIRPTLLTKFFVGGDILCFLVQAGGGGVLASSDSKSSADIGKAVILVGLALQMVIFGFFLVVAGVWHGRMLSMATKARSSAFDWARFVKMLYVVSLIVTFRNLFRVIEYAMGEDGYLLANEWPIYVFDAVPMVIVLAISCWWYVGDIAKFAEQQDLDSFDDHIEVGERHSGGEGLRHDA